MTGIMYDPRLDTTATADGIEIGVMAGAPGTVRVCVSGEIDLHTAAVLHDTLLIALASHRATLLLDLRRVAFCDCAGLNALLAAGEAARRAGRELRITAAGRPVRRLLQLTDTTVVFT
ncbi:STAS domain-containing protein [Streptomyces sp. NPDC054949]|uniref:STAS domain-containing protein n=1 Tax=unclassified Streptomyces TaxID=2593676 RepID=UPI00224DA270|nr:STAS domain-containing protein [Streptomyces sp. NBC_00424]MCX5079123.1 STAS domain-containing protein [Streptomyces sp. NBC_00424]WUD39312.1 STAS domain-containing protein [Streptomyces sp. NBC_00513]